MRRLFFLPFLAFLMGSDCDDSGSETNAPPINTLEVSLDGTQTTIASGDAALTVQWDVESDLSFTGFADDGGGLAQAWLSMTQVPFASGNSNVSGTGTSLTVTGTPAVPTSTPVSFIVDLHSRDAGGAETHGPRVIVEATGCVGTTVVTQDDCEPLEEGLYCDLTGDVCYGKALDSISNNGAGAVDLSPVANTTLPFLTLQPGQSSTSWGGAGLRGVGVGSSLANFELVLTYR